VTAMPKTPTPLALVPVPAPVPPVRQYSFTDFQVNNPTAPPPGDRLDAEYDRANASISQVISWVEVSLSQPPTDPDDGNSDSDAAYFAALASDYADVTQAWAEHMPDTIPPNILAVMGITGDHWSARWWAHQAAINFGARQRMQSLLYRATANQTVFPLAAPDLGNRTYTILSAEPLEIFVNGARLPDDTPNPGSGDWTLDPANSIVTFLTPLRAGSMVQIDIMSPDVGESLPYLPIDGGTLLGPLILYSDPVDPLGAVTKQYVDSHSFLPTSGGTMTGPLILSGDPTLALGAATKRYADTRMLRTGDTMTGLLVLSGDPIVPLGAATKQYVDSHIGGAGLFLPVAGGAMTGELKLAFDPVDPLDAATKQYVDNHIVPGSSDWISVKDYGAVGDGATDDTAAINAMIAGVPANAAVFWPMGTYKVTATITVAKNMTWVGSGRLSTMVSINQAAANLFVFNACVNITDMGFTCSVTATSGTLLTYNNAAARFRLKNFWMTSFFNGIKVNGTSDIMLIDGQMFNWAAGGTAITYIGGEAAVIDNLIIEQGTRPGNGIGLLVQSGGIMLINTEIMACGTCLKLAPGNGQAVVSMWVVNTAFDNAKDGVLIQPTGTGVVQRNWFSECWMCSMDNSGVQVSSPSVSSVDGLDLNNCHIFGNTQHGINIQDANARNINVIGCKIAGNAQTGIQFFAGSQNFRITNCKVGAYGGFGNNGAAAVNIGGSSSYYQIVNNDLLNGGTNPLIGAGLQNGTYPGTNEIIANNIGYASQNRGTVNIGAGATSIVVAHGLPGTPRFQDITLTEASGLGNPPAVTVWMASPNASTFTIWIGVAVGFTVTVNWKAVLPCTP